MPFQECEIILFINIILLFTEQSENKEHFDKILYIGQIENGIVSHETITLSDFTESNILLIGGKFVYDNL